MNCINKRLCIRIVATCVLHRRDAHADAVTDWNAIMQATVAAHRLTPSSRRDRPRSCSSPSSRRSTRSSGTTALPRDHHRAARGLAGRRGHRRRPSTLVTLHPGSRRPSTPCGPHSLAAIPDGPAKDAGIAVGEAAASRHAPARANDGWDAVVPYTPGSDPGDWQPTPPAFAAALLPGWGLGDAIRSRGRLSVPFTAAARTPLGEIRGRLQRGQTRRQDRQSIPAPRSHRCRALLRRRHPDPNL